MPQSRWKKNILAWVRRRKEKYEVLIKSRPPNWYTSFFFSIGYYHGCMRIEQLLKEKSDMRELFNDVCSMYVAWHTRDRVTRTWSEGREFFPSLRIETTGQVQTPDGVIHTVTREYPSNLEIENRRKLEEVAYYYNGMYSSLRDFYYQFVNSGMKGAEMTEGERIRLDATINGGLRDGGHDAHVYSIV